MTMIAVNINSHRTQLLLTAAATAFATYSLLSLYQSRSRQKRRNELAEDIKRSLSERTSSNRVQPSPSSLLPASDTEYAEHLVREQLARNYAFLGEEGVARVRNASVVIVGCGGVGSWAAVMLARSGVARLRLIDFDYVTLSSLNRHATAGLADVGTPKVQCVARVLRGIAPFVQVEPRIELWRGGADGADLLEGADWVVGMYSLYSPGLLARMTADESMKMQSTILAQRWSCLRTACGITSRCSRPWVQAPSPTQRESK